MEALEKYRDKWREVPAGDDVDGRVFSAGLLDLPDREFMATWDAMAERRASGAMAWFGPLYRDLFRGKRVLEIGSGAGVDGIPMAALGAHWTFADIVPSNLATIRRVAGLKGIEANFHLIGDDLSFEALTPGYDAILVVGSIHHVPYDITRREALNALRLLKVAGGGSSLSIRVNDGFAKEPCLSIRGANAPMAPARRGSNGTIWRKFGGVFIRQGSRPFWISIYARATSVGSISSISAWGGRASVSSISLAR